ncbi:MAG: hypothetical protein GY711_32955 [bacterium]|nr:hypothetical protein [bacterium]
MEGYRYRDWRFESDGHWSEAGNHLAAVSLYAALEPLLGLTPESETQLGESVRAHYASFEGWMPGDSPGDGPGSEQARAVRARYGPRATTH